MELISHIADANKSKVYYQYNRNCNLGECGSPDTNVSNIYWNNNNDVNHTSRLCLQTL